MCRNITPTGDQSQHLPAQVFPFQQNIMDRGQVYKLDYLGNTTVSKFAGLPSLQKPLRDIYALHMKFESQREQRNIASTALQTTDEGLYVRFRRGDAKVKAKGAYTDEEVFYPAPSILLWEAVSFVHVTADKKGKKVKLEGRGLYISQSET